MLNEICVYSFLFKIIYSNLVIVFFRIVEINFVFDSDYKIDIYRLM